MQLKQHLRRQLLPDHSLIQPERPRSIASRPFLLLYSLQNSTHLRRRPGYVPKSHKKSPANRAS